MPFNKNRNSRDDKSGKESKRSDRSESTSRSKSEGHSSKSSSSFNTERKPYGDKKENLGDRKPYGTREGSGSSYKDKKPYGTRSEGSYGDKKPYGSRSEGSGERKSYGDKREGGSAYGDKKPYGSRSEGSGERKSYGDKREGGNAYGDKKPYGSRSEGSGERKSYGDKREGGSAYGDKKPYSSRSEGSGERKSYGDKREGGSAYGDKKPYGSRSEGSGERKTYTDKNSFADRKAYGDKRNSSERKPFGDKKENFSDRKPFVSSDRDFGTEKRENFGERKPFRGERDGEHKRSISDQPFRGKLDRSADSTEFNDDQVKLRTKSSNSKSFKKDSNELIRLNRFISNSGICSRRKADELIAAGVVSVNGEAVTELGTKVNPSQDEIRYNGELLKREKMVYVLLNKPKDYITTTDDPQERKTVMELVEKASRERIYPVGRLDRNTTGLLLLTNDGDLADKLSHPKNSISKIYNVELSRNLTQGDFNKIAFGLELEDGFIKPDDLRYVTGGAKNEIGIQIHSGKNRIVRRIFESLGYEVEKLDRVIYANLTKKDLTRGRWRYLTEQEVIQLKHFTKAAN
ncbi:MAG: pseudouridine synthase [Bacteroidetes bacterium]|nr:pseudouridine synthase [Bacteroidota bacterium]